MAQELLYHDRQRSGGTKWLAFDSILRCEAPTEYRTGGNGIGKLLGAVLPMSEQAQLQLRDSIEVIDYLMNQEAVVWS